MTKQSLSNVSLKVRLISKSEVEITVYDHSRQHVYIRVFKISDVCDKSEEKEVD